jgi:hypothetical protein
MISFDLATSTISLSNDFRRIAPVGLFGLLEISGIYTKHNLEDSLDNY